MGISDTRNVLSWPTGISTDYDVDKYVEIDMQFNPSTARFMAHVSVITVQCKNLSSSDTPTKIYMRLTQDQTGDKFLITDTMTELSYGLTTTNSGAGQFRVAGILSSATNDTVYMFLKSDKGTFDVDAVILTWDDGRK